MQVSLRSADLASSVKYLGVANLDHITVLFLVFGRTSIVISTVAAAVYTPTTHS